MGRIKNIEFLRIVGCIAIVMLHFFYTQIGQIDSVPFYHYLAKSTSNGQKAVELFFMLSGLFYAVTYTPVLSTGKFLLKKIIRLYPVFLFCLIVYYFITLVSPDYTFSIYKALLNLFGFDGTIFVKGSTRHVGEFWYVSTMLWVLLLLHCSLKVFSKDKVKFAVGIVAFFAYGYILSSHGWKINSPHQLLNGAMTIGMLRGLGGISVGYLIGDWYRENLEKIMEWKVSLEGKILMTIVEISCLYFIIKYLIFVRWTYRNDTIFLISYILIIVMFLLKKGYISKILDIDLWSIFSKYIYSVYLSHVTLLKLVSSVFWANSMRFVVKHPIANFSLTLSLIFISGVIIYHLVEKPCAAYLKKRWLSE